MSAANKTPAFSLQIVVHETGLTPDTLRAWERRYGLPQPERTAGGHRLYSQDDIDMLKWLVARKAEGVSISRAVQLWRQLAAEDQGPESSAPSGSQAVALPAERAPAAGDHLVHIRRAWLTAGLAFDEGRAEDILSEAFALFPPEVVCLTVVQKGLSEIGEAWYQNRASVQQEHFISALAMRRLQALLAAAPPPARLGRILIGCPPGEEHSFSALLLAWLLRRQGWPVTYLGANVPLLRLEEALAAIKPKLVVMPAQRLPSAAALLEMASFLGQQGQALAYGGRIFKLHPTLPTRIPGYYLGDDLAQAGQMVERIITLSPPLSPIEVASAAHQAALHHFRERQTLLEGQIWQNVAGQNIPHLRQLAIANQELTTTIVSALALGDMALADEAITWVSGLLGHHRLDLRQLHHYLALYHRLAADILDERGAPILAWLERVTNDE